MSQDSGSKQDSQTKAKGEKQICRRQVSHFQVSFLARQEWASEQREIMD